MSYLGDFTLEDTFDFHFTTRRFTTGAPFVLAGTPVISAYEDNSTTQITAGITLTADFDTVAGLNHVRMVATAANGYEAGKSYSLVITTGTVDSVSVVGEVVGYFTLGRSAAFTRLGAPAGASVSADVAAVKVDTAAILVDTGTTLDARIPAALVGGRMDADIGAISTDAAAANALETMLDGTGGNKLHLSQLVIVAAGNDSGVDITGAGTGAGLKAVGGATGNGMLVNGGGTSGSALKIQGASGNAIGMEVIGQGSAAGLSASGGPSGTGAGFAIAGGSTSGGGIVITTTDGHAINAQATGASTHGLRIVGGNSGISDGINATAGTGGVPIRGDITGNITGNLSGSAGSVTGAVGSVTGAVGSVTGAVGSVTGAVGSVTGNVGGNVAGSVATVTTVNGLAANVITAASLAADAGTELAAAVLTAAAATPIDANVKEVNDVALQGVGTVGDKWRPV